MDDPNHDLYDEEHRSCNSDILGDVSCTTFNILAPIYKHTNDKSCESEFRELWISRNESILDRLLELKSSIICLQEFWVGNEELAGMYEKRLGAAGYLTYKLARTNNRGDGLLTAVHQNHFHVLNHKECLFNDLGDRVAQLLHVELLACPKTQSSEMSNEALIVNTHLIFPHDSSYCFIRLQQAYKILQFIESYSHEYNLPSVPIILCGDWNGSKNGNVCKFLLSQGFVSCYDIAHHYRGNGDYSYKWISHRNHRGNVCGVDFIWLLNPNKYRKTLKQSFMEAFLGNVNNMLHNVPAKGVYSHLCLETGGNYITYSQFSEFLAELGIRGKAQDCLSDEEIKELWTYVDTNGDGMIDLSHFSNEGNEDCGAKTKEKIDKPTSASKIGFRVIKAMLFPQEVERGMWPENYSLSDHAHLTVEFSILQSRDS